MGSAKKAESQTVIYNVILWGALWGIFEATVGYLIHLVSFGYSFLIWYPVACFFMSNVYRKTGRISSVLYIGLLCAAIKMLNLLLPVRIDKVINPAISIVFEALSMAAVIYISRLILGGKQKKPIVKALMAFSMNSGWRLLYVLYLLFLVPDWIRDVSVLSSATKLIPFLITQNLLTSALVFAGYQFISYIFLPLEKIESRLSLRFNKKSRPATSISQTAFALLLLCINIVLQFALK